MSTLEALDSVVGPDGRGLISAWRQNCWLPRDQFEVHVARLVESGLVRLIPDAHADGRSEKVRDGGITWNGQSCNIVEKLK